jgi:hypothetical protein
VDRLLGNRLLHRELGRVYRAVAHTLFAGFSAPCLRWIGLTSSAERVDNGP